MDSRILRAPRKTPFEWIRVTISSDPHKCNHTLATCGSRDVSLTTALRAGKSDEGRLETFRGGLTLYDGIVTRRRRKEFFEVPLRMLFGWGLNIGGGVTSNTLHPILP